MPALAAARMRQLAESPSEHEQAEGRARELEALDNAELFERERQSRQRLEVALEAGRMGTWDWDARTNRVTWSTQLEAIHGLAPGTFAGTFEAYLADVHPDDLERVRQGIAESLERGEHHVEYRIVWPDRSVHWVEAHGRVARDGNGQPTGMRGVCLESTRSRVFRALHEIAVAVGGVLEPSELARLVAERACELLGADGVGVYLCDDSATSLLSLHSLDADERSPEPPIALGEGAAGQAFVRGEPVSVGDYATWPEAGPWARAHGVAAALAVPLRVADRCIGALSVRTYAPRVWTEDDARTLSLLAAQVGPGLEAARLYKRTREEARERGILLAREQLSRERLEVALEGGRMGTWDWDARTNRVTWSPQLEAIHGFEPGTFGSTLDAYFAHLHPDDVERARDEIAASLERGVLNIEYRGLWPTGGVHWFEARGRAVRDTDGQAVGMRGVCLDVTARKQAEEERARLLQRERAALEAKAALEERQKLARELHDSVSQALYGIALGTQTALDALAHDQDRHVAVDASRYVLSLAEAGLAELRALIFELRPESLEQEGLVAALEQQAAAARARHEVQVVTELSPEPDLPLVTKEALYRIAQEGLHNTIKHARARVVRLRLERVEDAVVLEIADDGAGFDPGRAYPGHLGLTSMRERARGIGGQVVIRSAPGQGTRVQVRAPLRDVRERLGPPSRRGPRGGDDDYQQPAVGEGPAR
jgi:PAS domain S-box-containing protein